MKKEAVLFEWQEPIVFMHRNDDGETTATYVDRSGLRWQWFKKTLAKLSKGVLMLLGIPVAIVTSLYMLTTPEVKSDEILTVTAYVVLLILKYAGHKFDDATSNMQVPGVRPAYVRLTEKALILEMEDGGDHWRYENILRSKVGSQLYSGTLLKQLRVKTKGNNWYTIMIAPEIKIKEVAQFLRSKGIRVSENIERIEAGAPV